MRSMLHNLHGVTPLTDSAMSQITTACIVSSSVFSLSLSLSRLMESLKSNLIKCRSVNTKALQIRKYKTQF
jgi:hypothetical protein